MNRNPWLIGIVVGLLALIFACSIAFWGLGAYLLFRPGFDFLKEFNASPDVAPPAQLVGINRIVIVDSDGQLATMNPEGEQRRTLTDGATQFLFPAWSPDGANIAAVGADSVAAGVFVMPDSENASPVALYQSPDQSPIYLYWSPDSNTVSFLANDPEGLALWLADSQQADSTERVLTGQPFYWQWGLNNQELFVHTGAAGEDARLGFFDRSGQPLGGDVATPGLFQAPGIAPSGRYLAYAEVDESGMNRVQIQEREGGEVWQTLYTGAVALTWSPVADQLAFMHPPRRAPHFYGPIHLFDVASGERKTLTTRTAVAFFWSPDGRSIAYLSPSDADNTPGARLVPGLQQASPTLLDLWLIDTESGAERRLFRFRPGTLFAAQFLPFFDQYALSHHLWSPQSDALVLPVLGEDGVERIYVIPTGDDEPRPIADGGAAFWSWQ
ncbi:MAG: PD40 domain-containing protein [Caldilineales bacterium]|nr:PD40 domain-containing protein [Caldilineales bacterium]